MRAVLTIVGLLALGCSGLELPASGPSICCCAYPTPEAKRYRVIGVDACDERQGTCMGSDEAQCRRADRESRGR